MVVVVILGVLSAVAVPYMGRDKRVVPGREFTGTLMRELQIARLTAVNERLAVRVYLFGDRVELRMAVPGERPGEAPRSPTLADPVLRTILAPQEVALIEAGPSALPPGDPVLSPAFYREIEFNPRGQAQLINQPPLTPFFVYVRNDALSPQHRESRFRLDVTPLTSAVAMHTGWP